MTDKSELLMRRLDADSLPALALVPLPPLPKPAYDWGLHGHAGAPFGQLFSAVQMQAYARAYAAEVAGVDFSFLRQEQP